MKNYVEKIGPMILLLTAGFTKVCTPRSGGIKTIWLANRTEIATGGFTLVGSEYTAVTMEATKVFYKFEFDQDTAEFRPVVTSENNSTLVTTEVEFFQSKLSTLMRDALQEMADASICGMVAIVEDNNLNKWVVGYSENHKSKIDEEGRPLKVSELSGGSGKLFTDLNGSTNTLVATNNELPRIFTGTVPV